MATFWRNTADNKWIDGDDIWVPHYGEVSGSIDAVSTVTGATKVTRKLVGSIVSQSSVSGIVKVAKKLTGSIAASSTMTGIVLVVKELVGTIAATSTVSGTVKVAKKLIGTIAGISVVFGSIRVVAVFPTRYITAEPSVKIFTQQSNDPVLRGDPKNGAILVRARTVAVPIRYHINYPVMDNTDKEYIENWEENAIGCGGRRFEWINPLDDISYVSKLTGPIDYRPHPSSAGDIWNVSFNIETIYPVP